MKLTFAELKNYFESSLTKRFIILSICGKIFLFILFINLMMKFWKYESICLCSPLIKLKMKDIQKVLPSLCCLTFSQGQSSTLPLLYLNFLMHTFGHFLFFLKKIRKHRRKITNLHFSIWISKSVICFYPVPPESSRHIGTESTNI